MIVVDPLEAQNKISRMGVHLCVMLPGILLGGTRIMRETMGSLDTGAPDPVLGYFFIALALSDIAVAYFMRRRILTPSYLCHRLAPDPKVFAKQLSAAYFPVLMVCAAPALYATVFFFLGGDLETQVLLSIVCPAGYLATKPRRGEIERIAREVLRQDPDSDIHL